MYVHQRIDASDEQLVSTLASERGLLYVCGIAGMELGVLQQLTRALPAQAREHYLQADSETLANVQGWTRTMLHKQVQLTRRVFLEVY
jgi:sulfite reductase alpha subunit-like flavoprotein